MNEQELPDDIKIIDRQYISPEETIQDLEVITLGQFKRIRELEQEVASLKKQLLPFLTSEY